MSLDTESQVGEDEQTAARGNNACELQERNARIFHDNIVRYIEFDNSLSPARVGFYVAIVNSTEMRDYGCTSLGQKILSLCVAPVIAFHQEDVQRILVPEFCQMMEGDNTDELVKEQLNSPKPNFVDWKELEGFVVHLIRTGDSMEDIHLASVCPSEAIDEIDTDISALQLEFLAWLSFLLVLDAIDATIPRNEPVVRHDNQVLELFQSLWDEVGPIFALHLKSRTKMAEILSEFDTQPITDDPEHAVRPLSSIQLRILRDHVSQFRTDDQRVLAEHDILHDEANTEKTYHFIDYGTSDEDKPQPKPFADDWPTLQKEYKVHSINIESSTTDDSKVITNETQSSTSCKTITSDDAIDTATEKAELPTQSIPPDFPEPEKVVTRTVEWKIPKKKTRRVIKNVSAKPTKNVKKTTALTRRVASYTSPPRATTIIRSQPPLPPSVSQNRVVITVSPDASPAPQDMKSTITKAPNEPPAAPRRKVLMQGTSQQTEPKLIRPRGNRAGKSHAKKKMDDEERTTQTRQVEQRKGSRSRQRSLSSRSSRSNSRSRSRRRHRSRNHHKSRRCSRSRSYSRSRSRSRRKRSHAHKSRHSKRRRSRSSSRSTSPRRHAKRQRLSPKPKKSRRSSTKVLASEKLRALRPRTQFHEVKAIIFSESSDALKQVIAKVCTGEGNEIIYRWNEFDHDQKGAVSKFIQQALDSRSTEVGKAKGWEERKSYEKKTKDRRR